MLSEVFKKKKQNQTENRQDKSSQKLCPLFELSAMSQEGKMILPGLGQSEWFISPTRIFHSKFRSNPKLTGLFKIFFWETMCFAMKYILECGRLGWTSFHNYTYPSETLLCRMHITNPLVFLTWWVCSI